MILQFDDFSYSSYQQFVKISISTLSLQEAAWPERSTSSRLEI
jgi:hypothetical protein